MSNLGGARHIGDEDGAGYAALVYGILERAVEDVKWLIDEGVIVDGKAMRPWPKGLDGRPKVVLNHYHSTGDVEELLYFLRSKLPGGMLCAVGSNIQPDAIVGRLGIGAGS